MASVHRPGFAITDWDGAYANMPNIPGGADYPQRWAEAAAAFRAEMAAQGRADLDIAYGPGERQSFDRFRPRGEAAGVAIFVHGGYWMRFDKSFWSHLAQGALARGLSIAFVQYPLCPDVGIDAITRSIGLAVDAIAARNPGPLFLAGHSAGGHLVTRMVCCDTPLSTAVTQRIRRVVSISGVHDLRPLTRLEINATLRLDDAMAEAESPALKRPLEGVETVCWVGGSERAEFLRQNALLANVWHGLGARAHCVEEPDRHHFDVVEGLADPASPLSCAWLDD
jgi:arylformamidase